MAPRGGIQADDVSGILSLGAGAFLLCTFVYFATVSTCRGRRKVTRVLRRGATAVGLFVAAYLVALPLGVAYFATHAAGEGITSAPDLGVPSHRVEFAASDGVELTGWYAPTRNGAVVLILPGRSGIDQARMLAGHGYGVLLMNRRGEGDSEGDTNLFGWSDPSDVAGAAAYLRQRGRHRARRDRRARPVGGRRGHARARLAVGRPGRRGVWKASAPARSRRASSSPGGIRVAGARRPHPSLTGESVVFADQAPAAQPRRGDGGTWHPPARFIVWGEDGQPAEKVLGPTYVDDRGRRGDRRGRCRTLDTPAASTPQPEEYERRVIAFFDSTLLHEPVNRTHPRSHLPQRRVI